MTNTKAAVLKELGKPLEIMDLMLPDLLEGQVLVKVVYSGICHSQLNEIKGKKGVDPYLPHTLGHEGSGIVLSIGPGVTKVKEGDHVVLSWIKSSGKDAPRCFYKNGSSNINSGAISTFLTLAVISESRLISIPKHYCLKQAALLGCAIPTGAGIIFNTLKAKPQHSIAIFGMGGIGSSCLLAAAQSNLNPIIAIDILDAKLEAAKQNGATHCLNALKEDIFEQIHEITNGKLVDYSVECAGVKRAMELAYKVVNLQKGMCVLAGNLAKNETIEINPFDLILGKKILGTYGGESDIEKDIGSYLKLIDLKKLDPLKLVTKEFIIDDINLALDSLEKGEVVRALIKMEQ